MPDDETRFSASVPSAGTFKVLRNKKPVMKFEKKPLNRTNLKLVVLVVAVIKASLVLVIFCEIVRQIKNH